MTKIKTSELTSTALNWAVAKCEQRAITSFLGGAIWVKGRHENGLELDGWDLIFDPHFSWMFSGPIIEREKISIEWTSADKWYACIEWLDEPSFEGFGITPSIAAMRTYVASKLGDSVEIPIELMEISDD
jgi:hypothetical protein